MQLSRYLLRSSIVAVAIVLLSGCAPKLADVSEIDAGYTLCQVGCTNYTVQIKRDGSYVVNDVLTGKAVGGVVSDVFSNLPLADLSACAAPSPLTQMDHIYLTVQLPDRRSLTCQVTATGDRRGKSPDSRIRQFVALNMSGVYFDALLPRRTAIHEALRANALASVEVKRTGCFGMCPNYDALFKSDGSATLVQRGCPTRYATVPFDRVRTALFESGAELLAPRYPYSTEDTPGATIMLSMKGRTITSEGADAASWGPEFAETIARIDQLVADTTWSPPLAPIMALRPSQTVRDRNACQRSPWVIIGNDRSPFVPPSSIAG